ncbi:MAG: class I SAM-dependent methyltransferase [Ruminococcus flavefaciens]|nr:class I SAM-dependent methyltransferase [Ruminococcus flavefaciens]
MPIIKGLEWTFDTVAQQYEKLRPEYVPELYEDIFHYKKIDEKSHAIEVGIGGGQATLPVLKTGCQITAVEYGQNFSELCRQKFREFPGFSVVTSKFEDFSWESNSCDLVYSASAFHWVPEEVGYPKVFDMLKSGGAFARFANHPYKDKGREEIHQALQKIYDVYMPNSMEGREYDEKDAKERADIAKKYGFVEISYKLYHRMRTFCAKEYTALLGTYSDHMVIEEKTRKKFFAEIEDAINQFGGQITIYDTIDLQLARKP